MQTFLDRLHPGAWTDLLMIRVVLYHVLKSVFPRFGLTTTTGYSLENLDHRLPR